MNEADYLFIKLFNLKSMNETDYLFIKLLVSSECFRKMTLKIFPNVN